MSDPDRIGQVLAWFEQARQTDRLAHAYLVIGSPTGDARAFIDAALPVLLCRTGAATGCGTCRDCLRLRENRHQDVFTVEPQGKSCTIPVDAMRELLHRFGQTALSGGRKVAVIWGAERLGEEAANAFLKTLEEPPEGSTFFLVTPAPASVLATVRSRCQRISLSEPEGSSPIPEDRLEELFAIIAGLEPDDGEVAPAWTGLAAAHRFLALCGALRKEIQKMEIDAAGETDDKDAIEARVSARFKEQRAQLLLALQLWYRDVMLSLCGAEAPLLRYGSRTEAVRRVADRLSLVEVLKKLETLELLHRRLESNVPDSVAVHTAFTELAAR